MVLLIVDDDQDQCDSLADVLKDVGYVVDIARSGKQAVEGASRKSYLLMLLDSSERDSRNRCRSKWKSLPSSGTESPRVPASSRGFFGSSEFRYNAVSN
jgi:hypothetical protein